MKLFEETNKAAGSYYAIMEVANLRNIAIQYKIIAAASDDIELQLWGTVHTDAVDATEDDWVEITDFLTERKIFNITDETVHEIAFLDSELTLAKIKIKYIVTTSAPNNYIKIGWNTDR